MIDLQHLPQIIAAVGALGTAAFGLVDASKALGGGVNHIGFGGIKSLAKSLTPGTQANALSQNKVVATLQANWFNGTDLASQKSIAKSLIKLNLSPANARDVATATGVDPDALDTIAKNQAAGTALPSALSDVYARFDLILTALLDEVYQRSDNLYRNWTRAIAALVAVILAILAGLIVQPVYDLKSIGTSVLAGLLATPLAPIAKDLSSALATAVNTMQALKK
jgi:HAMP domain-containing protein